MTFAGRRGFLRLGASLGAALGLARSARAVDSPDSGVRLIDVIGKRRSVRHYRPTAVPEGHLETILDAARLAPTSGNQQPWRFLVVRERTTVERIKQETLKVAAEKMEQQGTDPRKIEAQKVRMAPYLDGILSAPVYVLVLTDNESRYPSYNVKDGSLAAGQLMLAARALGYGTVFLTDGVPDEATRRVLAIPDRYERIAMIPIGIPAEKTADGWPESPPKKAIADVVSYESLP